MLMGRGPKPAKSKEAKPPVARKSSKGNARVRDLEKRLAEALEQQEATSEILRVIAGSSTSAQDVFEAIARNAARLCDANAGAVSLLQGEWIEYIGRYNFHENMPTRIGVSDAPYAAQVIRQATIFHIPDVEHDPRVTPEALRLFRTTGNYAYLSVPMKSDGLVLGSISVARPEPAARRSISSLFWTP
jgi:two-component system, NtrC family, sensor kinase